MVLEDLDFFAKEFVLLPDDLLIVSFLNFLQIQMWIKNRVIAQLLASDLQVSDESHDPGSHANKLAVAVPEHAC